MAEGEKQITERPSEETDAGDKLILRNTGMSKTEKIIKEAETENEETKKVNSFNTILSIWNSMVGSSIVAIPYNTYYSGIIPAVLLNLIYGFLSFYTCKIYADCGRKVSDFSITVESHFNKAFGPKIAKIGKNTQIFFCTFMATGGMLIYFLIMNQNFYPVIALILNKMGCDIDSKDLKPEFGRFSLIYLGIILCFVLFPFIIKKDVGFLVNVSALGIYFVSVLIIFVIYTGFASLINTDFDLDYIKNKKENKKRHLKLFGENPALFAGTLSMGYFCHTAILPILKSNKKQENNTRDLILGYIFVGLTYTICGIFGYIGFSGKKFDTDFEDNWLSFFNSDNYLVLFFRLLNVFQLISAFPILAYIVRFQIFTFFYGNEYPSKKHTIIYGISLLFLCLIVLYFCYNILGKFLAIFGASASIILLYTFPPLVKMISYYYRFEEIDIKEKNNENEEKKENTIKGNNISINEDIGSNDAEENNEEEKKEEEKKENKEEKEENKEEEEKEKEENKEEEEKEEIKKEEKEEKDEVIENNKNEVLIPKEKEKGNNQLNYKDILFYIGHSSFIVIGIFTVICQFVPINFFNISLKD